MNACVHDGDVEDRSDAADRSKRCGVFGEREEATKASHDGEQATDEGD
jgi:hypothetical protein